MVHLLGYYMLLLAGAVLVSLQQSTFGVGDLLADLGPGTHGLGLVVAALIVVDWLLVSCVLHVAAILLGGDGSYRDTLGVVAWSTPATLVALLVVGAVYLLALWGNPLVMSFDAKLLAIAPAVSLAGVIGGLLTLLWQGRIWPAGLQPVHDVSPGTAGRATGVTVLVCALALLLAL